MTGIGGMLMTFGQADTNVLLPHGEELLATVQVPAEAG